MKVSAAEAVAAIEAIERHRLSIDYSEYPPRGYRVSGPGDWDSPREGRRRWKTVIEAVAAWCLRNRHGWPVTAAEAEETP